MLRDTLGTALFSPARLTLLGLLFAHPDESFYLRQIAQRTGLAIGQVQRETQRLVQAGIFQRSLVGRHVFFRAAPDSPLYEELRAIIRKTVGGAGAVRSALLPLSDQIRLAFIFGSVARGQERSPSDLDLLVVGSISLRQLSAVLGPAQDQLHRPINPVIYTPGEFAQKTAERHHFLASVLRTPKLFVLGDEHELRNLSSQRLDQTAPNLRRRNHAAAGRRRS
jgi:predicted nucleotidyltransferase